MNLPNKQCGFINLVGAALGVASMVAGNKARKKQNAARRDQQQANRIRNFQAKRQFLRDFQIAQAQAMANPLARGADVSSSFAQATASSQRAQAGVASVDFAKLGELGESASASLNKAANSSFQAGVLGTLGQFAMSDAGQSLAGDAEKAIKGIFS